MEKTAMTKRMNREKKVLNAGKYLRLVDRDGWEYVERVNCSGVVIIVGKTTDDKIVLVEQFRHPVQKLTIGFPAGLVGDERGKCKESIAEAARREMVEETGYLPSKVKTFFVGPMAAGISQDMLTFVHASGLKKVGLGGGVDEEDIRVHEVPVEKVDFWLKAQVKKGRLIGPNVFAGLYFLEHWIK